MSFIFNSDTGEFENHDYSYLLTIDPNDDKSFTAYFWTYRPGFFDPHDGGYAPEWDDFEIGTYGTLQEAEQAALKKVKELEEYDRSFEVEFGVDG